MQKEFEIHCYDEKENAIDRITDIAFHAGKDSCGCMFSNKGVHTVYGAGKHSDAVRVYSALKANNINIIFCVGV
jgi:hypothetical protein